MPRVSGRAPDAPEVTGYREAVDATVAEMKRTRAIEKPSLLGELLREYLGRSQAGPVLTRSAPDLATLVDQATAAAAGFSPSAAATAFTAEDMVKILLLQQVDLAWWSGTTDFETDAEIAASPELIDLAHVRATGGVRFDFSVQSDRLLPRMRNFAARKMFSAWGPGTPGLSSTRIRPEMLRVLNVLAEDFADQCPPGSPPLWVNSVTRSVEQQRHLRRLGFTAYIPSAHCRGWAADIEMLWLEQFGTRDTLAAVLLDRRDRGDLNVIDEGRIWHVSPSPARLHTFGVQPGSPLDRSR